MLIAFLFSFSFFIFVVLAFAKKPIYGLYAYFLAFYLHPPEQWWGKLLPDLRWSFLAALVTFVAVVLKKSKDDKVWLKHYETKVFSIFTIYVLLQSYFVYNFQIHTEYMILSIKFVILMIILEKSVKNLNDTVNVLIINLLGCAYWGFQGLGGGRLENLGTAGLNNSNQLGQHLAVVIVFSAFLLLINIGKKKLIVYPLLLLSLNGLIMTESRSSIIALVASGIFVFLFADLVNAKKKFYYFGGLGVLGFAILLGPGLIDKFSSIVATDDIVQDGSARSRLLIIEGQIAMFKNDMLLGSGHRGTYVQSPFYMPESVLTRKRPEDVGRRSSHNFIMTLLVDHGIIGAGLYLLVIWASIIKIFKIKKLNLTSDASNEKIIIIGLIASLVCFMVAGLGSNNKKLEIGIWLYSLIPIVFGFIYEKSKFNKSNNT
jgi:hypothetical protein